MLAPEYATLRAAMRADPGREHELTARAPRRAGLGCHFGPFVVVAFVKLAHGGGCGGLRPASQAFAVLTDHLGRDIGGGAQRMGNVGAVSPAAAAVSHLVVRACARMARGVVSVAALPHNRRGDGRCG